MAFDPFGDFETKGYLRNHEGEKDPAIVKELEHQSFAVNVRDALENLDAKRTITEQDVKDTHATLFKDVYPWAGETRAINVHKGAVQFQPASYLSTGLNTALQSGNNAQEFRQDPGKFIGEIAYAHPFLDGNGRTISILTDVLARKAGFHIRWEDTSKADYLTALTKEIDDPYKGHLTKYLEPHMRDGVRGLDGISKTLTTLPGLSRPDTPQEVPAAAVNNTGEKPTLFLIAGPNGAGKSTLTATGVFPENARIIDPDAIQRQAGVQGGDAPLKAFREAVRQQSEALQKGQSIVVETTLAGRNGIQLLEKAKQAGFRTELHFVGLEKVEYSHNRVQDRVRAGGHAIPPETIEARFPRILQHLPEAIAKADQAILYDNSGTSRQKVAEFSRDQWRFSENTPKWAAATGVKVAQREMQSAQTEAEARQAQNHAVQAVRAGGASPEQIRQVQEFGQQAQREQALRQGRPQRQVRHSDGYEL